MSEDNSRGNSREPEQKEGKSEEVFEVEKILAHKVTDNLLLLQVRWSGYGSDEDTWEPEEDLQECASEVVAEYYKKLKVNDKAQLIENLQKQIKRNQSKHLKKRRRSLSDEETFESDGSNETPKKVKKQKKSTKERTPVVSKTPKVPTKAALKSYEATGAAPVRTNNAKKAAMEVRDNRRTWLDDSSDEEVDIHRPESEIEKITSKVKAVKSPREQAHSPSKEPSEPPKHRAKVTPLPSERNSPSPQPSSSAAMDNSKKKNTSSLEPSNGLHGTSAPSTVEKEETTWCVNGIVRHTDESNNRKKLILMTHRVTGNRIVVESREAFELDGWAVTKYLLDRCEF